ncbi:hypothetical protein [Kurthia sibirica]|uniref:Uncharacterized protein n=1 Tax=Kurthia sibirica TaxID=202750 RepID=A0A2U3AGW2_9BACL|nr:hypothetical protein [Kurthia sibirica]PWI23734.1 hypothetical protein DEX24_15690 [Kurthia sibirica]GEK35568.1 hypothetical protein KSI01_31010 [Kurthia sibirica]
MPNSTYHTLTVAGPINDVHNFYNLLTIQNLPLFKSVYITEPLEMKEAIIIQLEETKAEKSFIDYIEVDSFVVKDGYFSLLVLERNTDVAILPSLTNVVPFPKGFQSQGSVKASDFQEWYIEEIGVLHDIVDSDMVDSRIFKDEQGRRSSEITLTLVTGFGNLEPFLEKCSEIYPELSFHSTYQSVDHFYAGVISCSDGEIVHEMFNGDDDINYRAYILENTRLPIVDCPGCDIQTIPLYDNHNCPKCATFVDF